ncbi:hypothetical protein [Methylobacterium sp. ARG-1]|uniref:hypothetical protein n=1 Tax=Methylobacterium sp. ARG-1 TaxID=1692501 RepID=UPI000683456D|nr:hypothetical protein [Methylobacterium sp. ARG-1]KNY21603.1 hypothetical protein AKJ13_15225 [Methylobacterium sp. ARG-1]
MRQFIIGEDVLGAVAQCIGAATHQVPYGQVAALIRQLETLQQVQLGQDGKAQPAADPAAEVSEAA